MVNRSCSWRVRPCGGSERGGRSWRASCTAIRQTFTEDRSPDGHSVLGRRGAGSVLTSKPFSLNSRRARHKNQAFHRQCDEAPALPAFHRRGEAKVSGEGRIALADSIAATLGGLREAAGYICEHLGYSLGSLLDEKQPLTFAHTGAQRRLVRFSFSSVPHGGDRSPAGLAPHPSQRPRDRM